MQRLYFFILQIADKQIVKKLSLFCHCLVIALSLLIFGFSYPLAHLCITIVLKHIAHQSQPLNSYNMNSKKNAAVKRTILQNTPDIKFWLLWICLIAAIAYGVHAYSEARNRELDKRLEQIRLG
jgi:hypothetical protein